MSYHFLYYYLVLRSTSVLQDWYHYDLNSQHKGASVGGGNTPFLFVGGTCTLYRPTPVIPVHFTKLYSYVHFVSERSLQIRWRSDIQAF